MTSSECFTCGVSPASVLLEVLAILVENGALICISPWCLFLDHFSICSLWPTKDEFHLETCTFFFLSTLQFINQLLGVVPLSTPTEDKLALPADIRALQRHLCVVQLTRLLGLYHTMDKNQKLSVVRELMLRYQHGLEFGEQPFKVFSSSLSAKT